MQTHTSLIDNEMAETWILAVFINNRLLFFKYALYFKDCVIFFHKRNCYIPQNHAIFNIHATTRLYCHFTAYWQGAANVHATSSNQQTG